MNSWFWDWSAHFLCLQSHVLPTVLIPIAWNCEILMILIQSCSIDFSYILRVWTHRASASAARSHWNALCHLKMGPRPIPKRHHWLVLAAATAADATAAAAARCGHLLSPKVNWCKKKRWVKDPSINTCKDSSDGKAWDSPRVKVSIPVRGNFFAEFILP